MKIVVCIKQVPDTKGGAGGHLGSNLGAVEL